MSKNKRFIDAFEHLKRNGVFNTQKEAALKMKCSRTNMSSALKGEESVLTNSFLMRFANAFPQISIGWLMTGEGEMLTRQEEGIQEATPMKKAEREYYHTTKSGNRFLIREDGKKELYMSIVPIEALGSNRDEDAELIEEESTEHATFVVDDIHHGHYYAFRVNGNSMDDGTRNGFESGDVVLVRELPKEDWTPRLHIKQWSFWVIAFGNNVRIKQIISQDEEKGEITLHSLNPSPEYCDFTLKLTDIHHLYNIVQLLPHPRKF